MVIFRIDMDFVTLPNNSKKTPTDPWNIPPETQLPVYEGKAQHICILGFLGSVVIFLETMVVQCKLGPSYRKVSVLFRILYLYTHI